MATINYSLTDLGKALEEARKRRGLTQNQAAAQSGFRTSTWSTMIYGGRTDHGQFREITPRPENVAKAAYLVGLDIEDALALVKTAEQPDGYTIDDLPTDEVNYDLSLVPDQQLLAEITRRQQTSE